MSSSTDIENKGITEQDDEPDEWYFSLAESIPDSTNE